MAYRPPQKPRWNYVTAEAALVLTVLFLAFAAGIAGFAIGRATAEDNGTSAAETTTQATTSEATTSEATTTAETQTETSGETNAAGGEPEGEAIFNSAGCAACHTFAPAGSSGTVGPNLDNVNLTVAQVEQQVQNGGGGMPPFKDRLSNAEITEVSRFVANG